MHNLSAFDSRLDPASNAAVHFEQLMPHKLLEGQVIEVWTW